MLPENNSLYYSLSGLRSVISSTTLENQSGVISLIDIFDIDKLQAVCV